MGFYAFHPQARHATHSHIHINILIFSFCEFQTVALSLSRYWLAVNGSASILARLFVVDTRESTYVLNVSMTMTLLGYKIT